MGSLSSLSFYRLGPPPIVKLPEIAEFLRLLPSTGILKEQPYSLSHCKLKFGQGIDQDGQTIDDYKAEVLDETDDDPFEFSGEWDLARAGLSCAEMAELFAGCRFTPKHPANLHRAYLSFGPTPNEVFRSILPPPELQNGYTWRGEYWSFEMGPVLLYSSAADEEYAVYLCGWMRLFLHGQGHRGPRSSIDLRKAAEANPQIAAAMELCRRTWPAPNVVPSPELVQFRQKMGPCWPYERYDEPSGWVWGLTEG